MNFESESSPVPRRGLGWAYWRLMLAQVCSQLVDGILSVALVWIASTLTRDPLQLSLVAMASLLPWLIVALPAGVLADRFSRRRLVAFTDAARCVVLLVFGVIIMVNGESLPQPEQLASGAVDQPPGTLALLVVLYVVATLLGVGEVVRDNAAQTLLPALVDHDRLEQANGRIMGAEIVLSRFVGPPLAGVLIAVGVVVPVFSSAALLAVAALVVFTLRGADSQERVALGRIAWRSDIGAGLSWLWKNRLLRTLALLLGTLNFLSTMAFVLFVFFVQEVLGLYEGWQFGLVMTGTAVGSTIGALFAARIAARVPIGAVLSGAMSLMALGQLAIGLIPIPTAVWICCAVAGAGVTVWNVVTVSLRQRLVPDGVLGRVNSAYRLIGWGSMAFAPLLAGLLVSGVEPLVGREWALRLPFILTGVLSLVAVAVTWTRITTATVVNSKAAESS